MSVEYTIICDDCGVVGDGSNRCAAVARRALQQERGWLINAPGGRDYCEDCRAARRRWVTS